MQQQRGIVYLGTALALAIIVPFCGFFKSLFHSWLSDPDSSYGLLIPFVAAYFVWDRRNRLRAANKTGWAAGLSFVILGCVLQVVAGLSGSLAVSGMALIIALLGVIGYVCGLESLRIVAMPVAFLILMVPLPSYVLGELTWYLQVAASRISGIALGLIGVPVYQDGNLIRLPNYILEVKEACSGSRSIFALLALALSLALTAERRWQVRIPLVAAAPVFAVAANVVRIVGTGLIAWRFGSLAADESLHEAWGIFVFIIATAGLLGLQRLLRWMVYAYA